MYIFFILYIITLHVVKHFYYLCLDKVYMSSLPITVETFYEVNPKLYLSESFPEILPESQLIQHIEVLNHPGSQALCLSFNENR